SSRGARSSRRWAATRSTPSSSRPRSREESLTRDAPHACCAHGSAARAFGHVAQVRARANGVREVLTQRRVVLPDAVDGVGDPALHVDARALRGAACASRASAEADRAGDLRAQRLRLGASPREASQIVPGFGLADLLLELDEAPPIRGARLVVQV